MNQKSFVDIRVVGFQPEIIEFLRLCRFIQSYGHYGMAGNVKVLVDGDGSGRLTFSVKKEDGSDLPFEPFNHEDMNDLREVCVDIGE